MTSEVRFEEGRTRYNDEGSRPAHQTRAEALMQANKAMVNLKEEAGEWVDGDMKRLGEQIAALGDGSGAADDALRPLYRTVCSIRDTSGHFGNNGLCVLANSFCELVSRMTDAGKCNTRALGTHFDALKLVHASGTDAIPQKSIEQLASNLQRLIAMYPESGQPAKG